MQRETIGCHQVYNPQKCVENPFFCVFQSGFVIVSSIPKISFCFLEKNIQVVCLILE
jgi:hypothetical protein